MASLWMPVDQKKRLSEEWGWIPWTDLWELDSLPSGIAEENVSMKVVTTELKRKFASFPGKYN